MYKSSIILISFVFMSTSSWSGEPNNRGLSNVFRAFGESFNKEDTKQVSHDEAFQPSERQRDKYIYSNDMQTIGRISQGQVYDTNGNNVGYISN